VIDTIMDGVGFVIGVICAGVIISLYRSFSNRTKKERPKVHRLNIGLDYAKEKIRDLKGKKYEEAPEDLTLDEKRQQNIQNVTGRLYYALLNNAILKINEEYPQCINSWCNIHIDDDYRIDHGTSKSLDIDFLFEIYRKVALEAMESCGLSHKKFNVKSGVSNSRYGFILEIYD